MKRIILIVTSAVLAIGMMLGLSACSIDVNTGGKDGQTYSIDLGDVDLSGITSALGDLDLSEISSVLGNLDLSGIADALEDVDVEGIVSEIGEKGQDLAQLFGGILQQAGNGASQITDGLEEFGVIIGGDSLGEIRDALEEAQEDVEDAISELPDLSEIAEEIPEEYQEALDMLKELLEANGLGEYYDVILYQIVNNPEEIQAMLESGSYDELFQLFGMSSNGASSNSEAADDAEEAEEFGGNVFYKQD